MWLLMVVDTPRVSELLLPLRQMLEAALGELPRRQAAIEAFVLAVRLG